MATIKTTLHTYWFDITKPEEKSAWRELKERLSKTNGRCFETHGGGSHYLGAKLDGKAVELETKNLFNDQWNTAPIPGDTAETGRRVFDWALDYCNGTTNPRHIKRGHYLDQTDEMREIRRNTNACGYCGHQERAERGLVFCDKCIDSAYLKESELHLLRMAPVDQRGERAELTAAERAHLLPLYREAQLHGTTERGKARIAKERLDIVRRREAAIRHANAEHDGKLWLMDHGVGMDNVIYYSHTGRFGFGWRQKMGADLVSALLDIITEFPFPYDIECADGRKLSGER